MKILMFSQIMYGGAWRRNFNVLKNMRKIGGVEFTLLLDTSEMGSVPQADQIIDELKELCDLRLTRIPLTVHKVSPLHYTHITKLGKMLGDIAEKENMDLIYVPHEVDWWILSAMSASKGKIPWTCLFHTTPLFICILQLSPNGPLSTMIQTPSVQLKSLKLLRSIYRYSRLQVLVRALRKTLSLSVSRNIARDLKAFYPELEIKTLSPAGIGIDTEYMASINPSTETFDAIYFTSELIPHKGFLDLPIIWKQVVDEIPDARLLIVGKKYREYTRQFTDLSAKYGLNKNIVLRELLPQEKLFSYVKSSEVMIYPSRFDAFPLVILESLASGVPVTAYDIPAVRLNYITESVVKCPLNDTECIATNAAKILLDDNLRKHLSQEAIKYAANFSWENVAKEEAKGYSKVLDFWSSK